MTRLSKPLAAALQEATRCIQCGFCLPACPTFQVFGEEKHSPRGRIQLVKAWAQGEAEPDASLRHALDLCLDCRACEIACPIDVQYGRILTGARDELAARATDPASSTAGGRARAAWFRKMVRHMVDRPSRLRRAGRILHWLVHSPPGRWLRRRLDRRGPSWLGAAMTFAVAIPNPKTPAHAHEPFEAPWAPQPPATVDPKAPRPQPNPTHVSLFLGCAQEGLYPETNRATAALLEQAGFHVHTPAQQGCCGALSRHNGDVDHARALVLRNLHAFGAFDQDRNDPIVMNAGGCMAWIYEAAELFSPGSAEHDAAQRMARRTKDISQLLLEATPGPAITTQTPPAASAGSQTDPRPAARVVYQPSCHLSNVCGVQEAPLALLRRVAGDKVQLPTDGGACCGSAGIYNALHPAASRAVLDAKLAHTLPLDPHIIVTSNPGCQLQMTAGVQSAGLEETIRVMQLPDFVLWAQGDEDGTEHPSTP